MTEFTFRLRKGDEPHPGHMAIIIDGIDAEYTNDPSQHVEKMTRKLIEKKVKKTDKNLALEAGEMAEKQSKRVLQRVAERIRKGYRLPGTSIPFDLGTGGMMDTKEIITPKLLKEIREANEMTSSEREERAVHHFINRGRLKDLSEKDRVKRLADLAKNRKKDHEGEWKERRKALIKDREKTLKELETKLKSVPQEQKEELLRRMFALKIELEGLKAKVLNASHGFQYANGQILQAAVNFVTGDIRIWPLMTNTTADTERDAKDQFSDFTTIDEFDGANYSSGGLALDNQAVNIDDANDRAEFDCDDETVNSLGAGTRSIQGVASGLFVTSTAASMPIYWHEFATNKTPDGSNFTFTINAEGLLQL